LCLTHLHDKKSKYNQNKIKYNKQKQNTELGVRFVFNYKLIVNKLLNKLQVRRVFAYQLFQCMNFRYSSRSCRYEIYLRVFELDIELEHKTINFISPSVHVLFCLLYINISLGSRSSF
jgi:hypothetical protein